MCQTVCDMRDTLRDMCDRVCDMCRNICPTRHAHVTHSDSCYRLRDMFDTFCLACLSLCHTCLTHVTHSVRHVSRVCDRCDRLRDVSDTFCHARLILCQTCVTHVTHSCHARPRTSHADKSRSVDPGACMPRKRARSRFIEDEAEVDDAEPAADDAAAEEDGVLDSHDHNFIDDSAQPDTLGAHEALSVDSPSHERAVRRRVIHVSPDTPEEDALHSDHDSPGSLNEFIVPDSSSSQGSAHGSAQGATQGSATCSGASPSPSLPPQPAQLALPQGANPQLTAAERAHRDALLTNTGVDAAYAAVLAEKWSRLRPDGDDDESMRRYTAERRRLWLAQSQALLAAAAVRPPPPPPPVPQEASSSSQGEELDELPVYHNPVAPAPPPRCWRCGTTTQDGGLFTREGEKRKCPRCRNTWWVPPQKPPQK